MYSALNLLVAVVAATLVANAQAGAPVSRCDRIGANPDDLDRVSPGVYWTVLEGPQARAACEEALEKHPDEPRLIYQYGRALARLERHDEAVSYLARAAEQGHLIAYTTIGGIYHFVTRNYGEAANWYRQGAELGSASAQVHLGDMYRAGQGFAADPRKAVSMYRRAAVQGYALAQSKLAELYDRGIGVPRNPAKAAGWYLKAANEQLPRAQYAIGRMFLNGRGVARDDAAAARWLLKAAEQGYGQAQLQLAALHLSGTGVQVGPREAYYWYLVASRHRSPAIREKAEAAMSEMCRQRAALIGSPAKAAFCCVG